MTGLDPYDKKSVATVFGIAPALAAEIVYENDVLTETPERRFERMRRWAERKLIE